MEEQTPISIVHNIFIDFFGEENVDLQDRTILIHFPKVKVTNENDKSVNITHLWVKVLLSSDGTMNGSFQMIRSELTLEQFQSGYSHSHINKINLDNYNKWAIPCLGRGPIKNTLMSLCSQFSEEMWNLFCLELSKYVTVESLTGVPYVHLEKIGVNLITKKISFPFLLNKQCPPAFEPYIAAFIPVILDKKPFGFNFYNGSYNIAMSHKNLFITLSNLFIEWYNSLPAAQQPPKAELFMKNIIYMGKCIGGDLYKVYNQNIPILYNYDNIIGKELFRFKNKVITFNVTDVEKTALNDPNMSIFLSKDMVSGIINKILRTINNKYGYQNPKDTSFREVHKYI